MTLTFAGHNKRRHDPHTRVRPPAQDSERTNRAAITKRARFVKVTLTKVGAERKESDACLSD